ncbi:MAG: HDOD domain-containing protein [Sulfuricella sp.]|nr:HDOD domain-containing protein [Sulfuricella sp.]
MEKREFLHKIGRFEVIAELGKGAQSIVYLAYDPDLEREVAIKTISFGSDGEEQGRMLLEEARSVSNLRHANIVPIFEAGVHRGAPYLVFEYVEGETLARMIAEEEALQPNRAIDIIDQVLDAVVHAHQHDIVHRDLKPSNILISDQGVLRVTDFGVATRFAESSAENGDLVGTPGYLAPECITRRAYGPQSDIFAVGLILYEMLSGKAAVPGINGGQQMARIVAGPLFSAEDLEGLIDEKLGDILLKTLAFNPSERFANALAMKEALRAYVHPGDEEVELVLEDAKKSTLEFLLRRMRHKSDFPALSESVVSVNKIVSSEMENTTKLSNAVLKDFALVNKLLKVVNSVFYRQYGGGNISTISRAVVILGFDAVRNIAITLVLFEHLQNKAQAASLRDDFVRALLAGVLARKIANANQLRDAEESFICAMFHHLGRMLSLFYFPEESEEIRKRVQHLKISEETASIQVLGLSYRDMGIGIARTWGFPSSIINSMRALPEGQINLGKNPAEAEKMNVLVAFAHDLCNMVATTTRAEKSVLLKKIIARFGTHLPVSQKELQPVLDKALEEVVQYAGVMHINLQQGQFGKQVKTWLAGSHGGKEVEVEDDVDTIIKGTTLISELGVLKSSGELSAAGLLDGPAILAAGIQDISNSLVEGCALNDIMRMILETIYRGMGFQRVLLCVRDTKQKTMNGRFGFGNDVPQLIKSFKFPLEFDADVFHAALTKNVDILITDVNDRKIFGLIPEWFSKVVTAQTFTLFPLNIKNMPVALIYADKEYPNEINFTEKELSALRTLRNQALLAIKQSM